MPTRKRTAPTGPSTADLELQVQDYLQNRSMRERAEYREGRLKGDFMKLLEAFGELQANGHRVLWLTEPLPYNQYKGGKSKAREIAGIRRLRQTSQAMDTDKAMVLLRKRKLLDACTVTVTEVVVNEDAILAANFEGKISDDELKALYTETERFSFWLIDAGQEDEEDSE